MSTNVDWTLDQDTLRKQLLQLQKKDLIKICRKRNVTYSNNKHETVSQLLKTSQSHAVRFNINVSAKERKALYEQKSNSHSNKHGKHVTRFSNHELEAVGLSWLKTPPKLDTSAITTPAEAEDAHIDSPESVIVNEEYNNPTTSVKTTRVSHWAHYTEYEQMDEREQALKDELNKKIESYGSFEVMSSLLFGFAVSVAFQNLHNEQFDAQNIWNVIAEIAFVVFIIIVLICNAYTMIVLSLMHFYVHRYMADKEYIMATMDHKVSSVTYIYTY